MRAARGRPAGAPSRNIGSPRLLVALRTPSVRTLHANGRFAFHGPPRGKQTPARPAGRESSHGYILDVEAQPRDHLRRILLRRLRQRRWVGGNVERRILLPGLLLRRK